MKKLVLVSGGLDSTVLLYKTVEDYGAENVIALSIFYGQKHAIERDFAVWQCEHLGVQLIEADLSLIFKYNLDVCSLLQGSKLNIVHKSYAEQLEDIGGSGTISAYVPYRNGIFLSFATAVALQLDCDELFYGAHADDAAGHAYPDCTEEFIMSQACAIDHGTAGKVTMKAPWWRSNKAEIVAAGLSLGMAEEEFRHTWSCYDGDEAAGPCGTCGTCVDRIAAFRANGIQDML